MCIYKQYSPNHSSYAKNSPEGKGKTLVDVFLDNLLHLVKQLEGKAGTRQQKEVCHALSDH